MEKLGGERKAVQDTLIKYACQIGWDYVKPEEALRLRGGNTGSIFKEIFTNQMLKLNENFIDNLMVEELIRKLERLPTRVEGNMEAWEYLRGLKTVFLPLEKREKNVIFLDENISNNTFHVTDEFTFTNGTKTNRYDVVFLINGIPVFFVEAKSVAKFFGKTTNRESIIADALDQIRRYHLETPEMMTLFQITTVTNIIHFLYSATWSLSTKGVFNWKLETKAKTYEDLVKGFFDKERLIKIILHFILFTRRDDELQKVILRPHQMRAVHKITERAAQKSKKRALIWHTQGSGKTFTMIVAAQRILENPIFENPTVILLVDRNELETNMFNSLVAAGYDPEEIERERTAQTKRHLKELLQNDTRGLIVSMIHKFEGIPAEMNNRKNIFVLVDEAHRTTGGDLGNYLMGALPNATYIGFTGTPIDKTVHGKGTFIVFGKDDGPHGYLDKYGIAESIDDGTTVKLHYTLAPNDLLPDKEVLEKEFLNLSEAEGISDVEALNKVLEKAVNLRNMLKNKQRIKKVAKYVVEHFKEYVEPMGYKAFLVAVDREACALYKKELDKLLPKDYSEVVYSASHNDPPVLAEFHKSLDKEKKIRKAFTKPGKKPQILIVTEKLLTGFDAPILYCMYLDKPMRDHVLLQAIARVNRPYENKDGQKKPSGFVLDFVGIFDKLEKALAFDHSDIEGVIDDIEVLKEQFKRLMLQAEKQYLKITNDKTRDKAIEALLDYFRNEETRRIFFDFYKELSTIYEILSPDAFLRPFIESYGNITRMYKILKEAYEPGVIIDKEFTRKTAKLVQEHTKSGKIKSDLEIFEIDGNTIKKLEESNKSDTERIFNLLRSIESTVRSDFKNNPYLVSIGERAENLSLLFQQRQKDTKDTLGELKDIIKDINEAKKEQVKRKMPKDIFTIYWVLRTENIEKPEGIAQAMNEILEKYPHWKSSEEHERKFRQELYKIFTKNKISIKQAVPLAVKIIKILKETEK
jgi:type I restriction enzyme, R subunit